MSPSRKRSREEYRSSSNRHTRSRSRSRSRSPSPSRSHSHRHRSPPPRAHTEWRDRAEKQRHRYRETRHHQRQEDHDYQNSAHNAASTHQTTSVFRAPHSTRNTNHTEILPPYQQDERTQRRNASKISIWERSPSPPSERYLQKLQKQDDHKLKKEQKKMRLGKGKYKKYAEEVEAKKEAEVTSMDSKINEFQRPTVSINPPSEDEDECIGPLPEAEFEVQISRKDYGSQLMPGEAEGMAAYVQSGKRIPRRGEIGLTSNEIEKYEAQGFVMSGNRHRRMNEVRLRKENQVISAEERRQILKLTHQEKLERETRIIADFKEMLAEKEKAALAGA